MTTMDARASPRLILISGWVGAGKSTIASAIAAEIGATAASFDWLMSGLRSFPEIWETIETPRERQREIGCTLLSRVAEQQLRRGASCVLDLVAREAPRVGWQALAKGYGASFHVIECICSDVAVHKARLTGRERTIPGWYEISFEDAMRNREGYVPLADPKLVLDAVDTLAANLGKARAFLAIG